MTFTTCAGGCGTDRPTTFTDSLYQKLFAYIGEHKLQVCGNAYEEYLIDEIAEKNPDRYLLQIIVQVTI